MATGNLAEMHPALASQWNEEKNLDIPLHDVKTTERRLVWWKCPVAPDHVWMQSPRFRIQRKLGCPACANRQVSVSNNLKVIAPRIAAEWDSFNNGGELPENVVAFEKRKRNWICSQNPSHKFQASTAIRVRQNTGCPFCKNRRTHRSNSLAELNPKLASEWHFERNWPFTPETVRATEIAKRWWICLNDDSHQWIASTSVRHTVKTNCPYCSKQRNANRGIRSSANPSSRNQKFISIRDRSSNCAQQFDEQRNFPFTADSISHGSNKPIWWKCDAASDHVWQATPAARTRGKGICPFCFGLRVAPSTSLASKRPDLSLFFDDNLNPNSSLTSLSPSSNQKIYWRCPEHPDFSWRMSPNQITRRSYVCEKCARSSGSLSISHLPPLPSESLAYRNPEIAAELHPEINGDLKVENLYSKSSRRVWWRCSVNYSHVWITSVSNRTNGSRKCPFCSRKRTSPLNSIKENCPQVYECVNNELNQQIKLEDVSIGSTKHSLWTICSQDARHVFQATPNRLTTGFKRSGRVPCPFCDGKQVIPEESFGARFPDLIHEWDEVLNVKTSDDSGRSELNPFTVSPNSHQKVWWRCSSGIDHIWKSSIKSRTNYGCPYCKGQKVSLSTSLAKTFPRIAQEWSLNRNGDLSPETVFGKSGRKIWWECPISEDHTYVARISDRTIHGSGCPHCVLIPRSAIEIHIAYELSFIFGADPDDHRVATENGKSLDIDILLREQKIAIEYDGAYWHRDKLKPDKKKSDLLRDLGWNVIRVREFPLEKTAPSDISVPNGASAKDITNGILLSIYPNPGARPKPIEGYLNCPNPSQSDLAEAAIFELLSKRKSSKDKRRSTKEAFK